MTGPTVRNRYNRGTAVIASARDRRLARQLEAEALEEALTTSVAEALARYAPPLVDDDGEGLVDVDDDELAGDAATPEDYAAFDEMLAARDLAGYAEVAETAAFMRAYLRDAGLSVAECAAGGQHRPDPSRRGACVECGAHPDGCVDCERWVTTRTHDGLCAECALAHLEGVALSHLEAS